MSNHGFYAAYGRLSRRGLCDSPGGAECSRVLREWTAAGRPADVESFIRRRANILPGVDNDERELERPNPKKYVGDERELERLGAMLSSLIGTNGDEESLGFTADEVLEEWNQLIERRYPNGFRELY